MELALELNDENIYNLIKEKIEEGNRQGEIVAKELLIEDKRKERQSGEHKFFT